MRSTGQLFRWGLTCLLLAPVAGFGWFAAGGAVGFLWLALALVLLGGGLNAAAIVRGVRRVGSGALMTSLDGMTPADRAGEFLDEPLVPRQRVILVDGTVVGEGGVGPGSSPGPESRGLRRRVGLAAAAALLGLVAFGAYALAIEQPLAIAQGQLTLDEVYAVWNTASRVGFTISMTIWVALSLAVVLGVAVLALLPAIAADRILTPRRMLAAACIAGSAIVVAAWFPYLGIGISLPDDLPFMASGVQSPASLAFGLTGVALSAIAILITVPDWRRSAR
ncbi:hypothetical protein [Microcella humidisoli]|uniref:Uncharacterized protein n=1 Tax=Microcella humidisoli TaxID=2963406 RepID=A0ABY5FVD8_9MICO|nr:hypothetical protein [Microcella humidisoli]UTT61865.1 hypothetical protein NNL39_09280 [Microcella humidisoli]